MPYYRSRSYRHRAGHFPNTSLSFICQQFWHYRQCIHPIVFLNVG